MKNFDKGTVIRTVLLLIAFINQTLDVWEASISNYR